MWKLICSLINSLVWWDIFFPKGIAGHGTIELLLRTYKNMKNTFKDGTCCDGLIEASACRGYCGNEFHVCATNRTRFSPSMECPFGEFTTTNYFDDIVEFKNHQYSNLSRPLEFHFYKADTENLVIFINSHSSEKEIALFKIVSPLTKISKLKLLDGDWSKGLKELTVDVSITCDVGYSLPNCVKSCTPQDGELGHYNCTKTGNKICLRGWKGINCTRPESFISSSSPSLSLSRDIEFTKSLTGYHEQRTSERTAPNLKLRSTLMHVISSSQSMKFTKKLPAATAVVKTTFKTLDVKYLSATARILTSTKLIQTSSLTISPKQSNRSSHIATLTPTSATSSVNINGVVCSSKNAKYFFGMDIQQHLFIDIFAVLILVILVLTSCLIYQRKRYLQQINAYSARFQKVSYASQTSDKTDIENDQIKNGDEGIWLSQVKTDF